MIMIITEKDLQMLHTMPPPPPGEPLLPGREDDLKLGESRGVTPFRPPRPSSGMSYWKTFMYTSTKLYQIATSVTCAESLQTVAVETLVVSIHGGGLGSGTAKTTDER